MQKSSPLREPTLNREAIECVLRTRGARSGFVLSRTLDAPGDSNDGASGRSLSLASKTKNLSIFCVPPPTPSRLKKRRKGFLVLVRRFILQKATFNLHLFESFHFVFFRLHADPRRSAFECSSEIQPTLTIPPSPRIGTLAFACVACSVVAGVRFF